MKRRIETGIKLFSGKRRKKNNGEIKSTEFTKCRETGLKTCESVGKSEFKGKKKEIKKKELENVVKHMQL